MVRVLAEVICTTLRPEFRIPTILFLSFAHDHSTKKKIWSSFIYSFVCTQPFDQKLGSSLIYFFYLHTTIRQKYIVLFHSFSLSARPFDQKLRVLINLFRLFVHDHSTKIRGHSYSLIHSFLNCANISFAIFMAVQPLYFFRSFSGNAAFKFCPL